jgi:hypothetical protein
MGDSGTDKPVVCSECLEAKTLALYCCERCAVENLARHRQERHEGKAASAESGSSMFQPLSEALDAVLVKENPGLQFKAVDAA